MLVEHHLLTVEILQKPGTAVGQQSDVLDSYVSVLRFGQI